MISLSNMDRNIIKSIRSGKPLEISQRDMLQLSMYAESIGMILTVKSKVGLTLTVVGEYCAVTDDEKNQIG